MGTSYSVTIVSNDANKLKSAQIQNEIDSLLNEFNNIFSTYDPDSEISKFNRNTSTGYIPVSNEFYSLAIEARHHYFDTDAAFDITIKPLMNLWDFDIRFVQKNQQMYREM